MPIDPNLIGNAMANWQRPPVYDPLAQFAKIQALKNGIGQQQLQQQALQEGALGLQEKQKAIADADAMANVYKSAYTPDPAGGPPKLDENALYQGLATAGLGAKIPVIQKANAEANKSLADLQKSQTDAAEATQEYLAKGLLDVKSAGYDPAAFTAKIQSALDHKAITQSDAARLYQQFQQNPTTAGVQKIVDSFIAGSQKAQDIIAKQATAGKDIAQGEAATGNLALAKEKARLEKVTAAKQALGAATDQASLQGAFNDVVAAGATPAEIAQLPHVWSQTAMDQFNSGMMTAEQRAQAKQRADDANALAANRAAQLKQDAQRIGISQQDLQLRNQEYQKKYGDVLGNLSANDKDIAQKIANGDYSMTTLSRLPNKEQIMAGAIQINPAISQATYDTKQSFTNPEKTQAKNLGTISRIVGHIGRFEHNSQQMGFAPAYALGMNKTGDQAKLNEDAHAIAGELEKLVSGGVGNEGQTRAWQDALHSPSADARQKAVDEISQLIGSQYEGMNQTYKAGVGTDLPIDKYVTPAGQAWMKSKGINVTGAANDAPAAGTPVAKNPFRK